MEARYFGGIRKKRQLGDYRMEVSYLYTRALNECLHNHPEANTRAVLDQCRVEFAFDLEQFYFCLTGLKKNIYYSVYGHDANEYLEIFDGLRRTLMETVEKSGYKADIFIVMSEDTKQIAILYSPTACPHCTPETLAQQLGRAVQAGCDEKIFKGDTRYCNVTGLSTPLSGFAAMREGYQQTRRLCDLAFFRMEQDLLTDERLARERNGAEYYAIMDECTRLCLAVDEGDWASCQERLAHLFLALLKNSYSLPLCRDALSFCKHMLQVRCTVYGCIDRMDLEPLCAVESYLKIEECVDALTPVLRDLCAAVKAQGAYAKPVLLASYYIKTQYDKDISLPDVARYVAVNPTYLSGIFKESTGMALRDYVTATRVERAKVLLGQGGKKITEVARAVGFYDAKYFTRTFKRLTGKPPAEYREAHGA